MDAFHNQAARGDLVGVFKIATTASILWAIGTAWSTAVRSITLELFPHDTMDVVAAELAAASITTGLGIIVSLLVTRSWCSECAMLEKEEVERRRPQARR